MSVVRVGNIHIGAADLVLIAGPCVIESEAHCRNLAGQLREIAQDTGLPLVFKSSYDKANRSSPAGYRGPGLKEGLRILDAIRKDFALAVTSDIHLPEEAKAAGVVLDLVQIPAFLCRQTDLLVAAAKTGKPVNVKKGQFLAPWDMAGVVNKLREANAAGILLTERGTSFGYNRLVSDFRGLSHMRGLGCPVVFDATHSVQLPGGLGDCSGGERHHVPGLARAAVACGCDAVFIEVHDDPDNARSDGANSLSLDRLPPLLATLRQLHAIRQSSEPQEATS